MVYNKHFFMHFGGVGAFGRVDKTSGDDLVKYLYFPCLDESKDEYANKIPIYHRVLFGSRKMCITCVPC